MLSHDSFRDDEGGELSRCETAAEAERRAEALAAEDAARDKRRQLYIFKKSDDESRGLVIGPVDSCVSQYFGRRSTDRKNVP